MILDISCMQWPTITNLFIPIIEIDIYDYIVNLGAGCLE